MYSSAGIARTELQQRRPRTLSQRIDARPARNGAIEAKETSERANDERRRNQRPAGPTAPPQRPTETQCRGTRPIADGGERIVDEAAPEPRRRTGGDGAQSAGANRRNGTAVSKAEGSVVDSAQREG